MKSRKYLFVASAILMFAVWTTPSHAAEDLEGGIQEIAQQLSAALEGGKVKKLAVVEFPDLNGYQSALGQFVAEELITQLSVGANAGRYDVVERRQLARVLQEQELADSSLFDAQSIAKIGKILGIEAIVTGSIADLATDVKINARVISVETAKVFAAASTKIPKTDTVNQLMRQSAGAVTSIGASGASRPIRVQSGSTFFQNNFLRVEATALYLSEGNRKATVSLMFENTTERDIYIAVAEGEGCSVALMDENGLVVPDGSTGRVRLTGLACVYSSQVYYSNGRAKFTRFPPGTMAPVIFTFESEEKSSFEGISFTFSAEMWDLLENQPERFTIGIPGIQVLN
jgi:TolB-like protein